KGPTEPILAHLHDRDQPFKRPRLTIPPPRPSALYRWIESDLAVFVGQDLPSPAYSTGPNARDPKGGSDGGSHSQGAGTREKRGIAMQPIRLGRSNVRIITLIAGLLLAPGAAFALGQHGGGGGGHGFGGGGGGGHSFGGGGSHS